MRMFKGWKAWLLIGTVLGAGGVMVLIAEEGDALKPDTEIVAEQYLLVGNATRAAGESQVAVSPVNPNVIAVATMGVLNQMDGNFEHVEREFKRTPRYTITEFAITRDRGLTWHVIEDPMRSYFHRYRCLDPFAGFTPDGVMILGCEAHHPTVLTAEQQAKTIEKNLNVTYGGPAIVWSTDEGRTFSDPVEVLGTNVPKELWGPGVSFADQGTTADAPKIAIDGSRKKIYITGNSQTVDGRSQTVVRSSDDRGIVWGWIYSFDSPEWPGSGATMSAANGVLAAVYNASKVPADLKAQCPCGVFETSTDDGKTFERHLLPADRNAAAGPNGGPEGLLVGADPSKKGRFTVMRRTPTQVVAYVTEDSGKTWSAPMALGMVPNTSISNVTIGYNSKGVVGAAWRVIYPAPGPANVAGGRGAAGGRGGRGGAAPARGGAALERLHGGEDEKNSSEIWSAISRDGGKTFSSALKVSTSPSPGQSRRRGGSGHSADFDSIALDDTFVHMSWFDNRAGFLGTWYGRVPLRDYK